MSGAQAIRLALIPSGKLAMLILGMHAMAALCFLTLMTGWIAVSGALLLFAAGAAAAWDRALLRGSRSPSAIEIQASGEAVCRFAGGDTAVVEALGGSGVTRHWVALRLRSQKRRSLLVAGGMLPEGQFRLLRLWALWGRMPGVAPRQLPAGD